jgi:hypothetical protein
VITAIRGPGGGGVGGGEGRRQAQLGAAQRDQDRGRLAGDVAAAGALERRADFVDEPEQAVQEADALVAELMQRLAAMFATERAELEKRWAGGHQVTTEDLRQGLRRYRSFFERLLAA